MKSFTISAVFLAFSLSASIVIHAQTPLTSARLIEFILSGEQNREILANFKNGVMTALADPRLTDLGTRQILSEAQPVITDMLDQHSGTNIEKLVPLAKWFRTQAEERNAIHDAGVNLTPAQEFVLENPLAGNEASLVDIISGVLGAYVTLDGESVGAAKLDGDLEIYLSFRKVVEGGTGIPDSLLRKAPNWIRNRYVQLTDAEKRLFLKDVNDVRVERALPPDPESKPADMPPQTPEEQAAYAAAYQFIVNNTPQP